jgi:hypothetical protein
MVKLLTRNVYYKVATWLMLFMLVTVICACWYGAAVVSAAYTP